MTATPQANSVEHSAGSTAAGAEGRVERQSVPWLWLAGLVVVATLLRVVALNQQLWYDEIVTLLNYARSPISQIVTSYDAQNQHMLYSLLAHFSIRIFGEHPWSLRLPAVIFGVASIPALYFFGRLVTGVEESLLAAGLMTVNYQHVWFSQNARGYTALLFWTLLASVFFLRSIRRGNRSDWMWYGITAACGAYTHLTMVFVVVGHALVFTWRPLSTWSRRFSSDSGATSFWAPLYGITLCAALSLLLYAPILRNIFASTLSPPARSVTTQWTSPLWAMGQALHGLRASAGGSLVALLAGGLVLLTGLISYGRASRVVAGVMLMPGLVTAAFVLAAHHNFWPRFFFFEVGFAFLLIARGVMVASAAIARLGRAGRQVTVLVAAIIVAAMVVVSLASLRGEYRYPKQDYLGVMHFMDSQSPPAASIVTAGIVTMPLQRLYDRPWPLVVSGAQLDGVLAAHPDTWLVYAMPTAIEATSPDIWQDIQSHFTTVHVFGGTVTGAEIYVARSSAVGAGQTAGRPAETE